MSILNLILISILSVSFLACTKSGDVNFNSKEILNLEFLNKPSAISGDTNPTFNFELTNTVNNTKVNDQVEFQCSLDDAAYITCPETFNPSGLPVGPHNLKIRVLRAGQQIHLTEYDWVVTMAAVPFNIDGVSGANDSSADIYYANNTDADLVVEWEAATNADEYIVEIKDNTDTTTLCGPVRVSANTHTFTTGGLCTLVDGTSYKLHVSAENVVDTVTVATNSPLTITADLTAPLASFISVPNNPSNSTAASFLFIRTDFNSGIGAVECRLDAGVYSPCVAPVNLVGLSEGAHTYDLRVTDNAGNSTVVTHTWAVNTIEVNDFNYFPAQESVLFNNTFTASGGSGTFTYALTVNPNGATINPTTGVFAVTEASHQKINYTLRVTDTVTSLTKDFTFDVDTYPAGICVWNGFTSTAWATPSNWSFCGGAAPIATSQIAIGTAVNQPILAANQTIDSFGLGAGGGELTIAAGVTLSVTSATQSLRSSVGFKGSTITCTTCEVDSAGTNFSVVDGSVLTMKSGLTFSATNRNLLIGDGVTAGHLRAEGASGISSDWPTLGHRLGSVVIEGSALEDSTVHLNGLHLDNTAHTSSLRNNFRFIDHYNILNFDRVNVNYFSTVSADANIKFVDCSNATITDTSWTEVEFTDAVVIGAGSNIDASGINCSALPAINVSGSGLGYGDLFENDSNNKVNWANSSSQTCVWTGAVNTDWFNAGNWSSCINGRGNYPDQLDWARVPVTINQPIVDRTHSIQGFGLGAGGGTVSIDQNIIFSVLKLDQAVRSDIQVQGINSTCATCTLSSLNGDFYIVDGATLTLGNGLRFLVTFSKDLYVGDGVTAGHLRTVDDTGNSAEWPNYANKTESIFVQGTALEKSTVYINGLTSDNLGHAVQDFLVFRDHYDLLRFDNFNMNMAFPTVSKKYIYFENCTNGLVSDTAWTGLNFVDLVLDGTGVNIDAGGLNCSTLPLISVAGSGLGFGELFENDPDNRVSWVNGESMSCIWNGSIDSDWEKPGNWSNCTNGRLNYPDHLDGVIIPAVANQPILTNDTLVYRTAPGAGGGKITVSSGHSLTFTGVNKSIDSDVTIEGATSTCTDCQIKATGDFTIANGALLTLGNGIRFNSNIQRVQINVGDGVTSGHLATVANTGNSSEWPLIDSGSSLHQGIYIRGVLGDLSSVDIDGLRMSEFGFDAGTGGFLFEDFYEIINLDNMELDYFGTNDARQSYISIENCGNAVFTDLSWENINFIDGISAGHNIKTSCSGIGPISIISPTGAGAGAGFELDPNNVIDWP